MPRPVPCYCGSRGYTAHTAATGELCPRNRPGPLCEPASVWTPRTSDEHDEAAAFLESSAESIGGLSILIRTDARAEHFLNADQLLSAAAVMRAGAERLRKEGK